MKINLLVDEVVANVFNTVCTTMGPDGNYVIINKGFQPFFTKDGVTVANNMKGTDTTRHAITRVMIEPSIEADLEIGDGTTTSLFFTSLFYVLYKDTFNNYILSKQLEDTINELLDYVKDNTIYIDDISKDNRLYKLALTTSNNDVLITNKVFDILKEYGTEVVNNINVMSSDGEDIIDVKEEISFKGSSIKTNYDKTMYDDYYVLSLTSSISSTDSSFENNSINLLNIINTLDRPVIMFAPYYDDKFLAIIENFNRNFKITKVILLTIPAVGSIALNILKDLELLFNCKNIPNLNDLKESDFYCCNNRLHFKNTNFYLNKEELNKETLDLTNNTLIKLKNELNDLNRDKLNGYYGEVLKRRIATLTGKDITIKVGGETPSDMQERKARYVDVLGAVKNGLNDGIISGIGSLLCEATKLSKFKLIKTLLISQNVYLTKGIKDLTTLTNTLNDINVDEYEPIYINLSNNDVFDDVKCIDVYDASKALQFALRKGFSTAKNLAKCNGVVNTIIE